MKTVKCMICKLKCTGDEAILHKEKTGHNQWELIFPKRKCKDEH